MTTLTYNTPRTDVQYDIRDLRDMIVGWCNEVHPHRTHEDMITKLKEEFAEFSERPLDAWEMADIFIILIDLCDDLGFDIAKIVTRKMDINKNRSWKLKDGVLSHVRTA